MNSRPPKQKSVPSGIKYLLEGLPRLTDLAAARRGPCALCATRINRPAGAYETGENNSVASRPAAAPAPEGPQRSSMPPPSPKEVPTPKENIPPRPRVVGSPVASPSSEALRDGSNAASPPSRFEALSKGSNNATPQSRSVTLSPKSQRKKSTMAPAHVDDKPIPRVVSKEETKEEKPAPPAPKADKKHEPPSFLRDLVLYAALGASLGAAFALAVPPLPPPPEAAPSRLLIKAPLAPPPRAAANTQLLLAKDAEIERLRTEVKWALTDRGSDAAFKQELAASEQRTQQMLKELLRKQDALAARDTVIAELRAELANAKSGDAAVAPAPTRGAAPPAPGRRRRRLRVSSRRRCQGASSWHFPPLVSVSAASASAAIPCVWQCAAHDLHHHLVRLRFSRRMPLFNLTFVLSESES